MFVNMNLSDIINGSSARIISDVANSFSAVDELVTVIHQNLERLKKRAKRPAVSHGISLDASISISLEQKSESQSQTRRRKHQPWGLVESHGQALKFFQTRKIKRLSSIVAETLASGVNEIVTGQSLFDVSTLRYFKTKSV